MFKNSLVCQQNNTEKLCPNKGKKPKLHLNKMAPWDSRDLEAQLDINTDFMMHGRSVMKPQFCKCVTFNKSASLSGYQFPQPNHEKIRLGHL